MWPRNAKTDESIPGGYPPGAEMFLSAICANRADDTVRLVFADWLQENGDEERAEFIRLQIALHREHPDYEIPFVRNNLGGEWDARYTRQKELLERNASLWVGGFPRLMFSTTSADFVRGFPSRAITNPAQWHAHGERVRRWVPLEGVDVLGQSTSFADLFSLASLVGISQLTLPRATTDELRALVHSPVLDSLTSLSVVGRTVNGTIENPVLRALFGSHRLRCLRRLHLQLDRAGDTLGFVLAGSPHLRNLRALHVSDAMRAESARDLFDSPNIANVTELRLPNNPMGDTAIRGLVRSKYVTKLTFLELSYAELTVDSGRLLAGWPGLRTLNSLAIEGNRLGLDGLTALSESPHLEQLQSLQLVGNVDDNQLPVVRMLPWFARVTLL